VEQWRALHSVTQEPSETYDYEIGVSPQLYADQRGVCSRRGCKNNGTEAETIGSRCGNSTE
jgi:hypothetical protein